MALKRLVTSAALVILSCSDAPNDGVVVPTFESGAAPFGQPNVTNPPAANGPADEVNPAAENGTGEAPSNSPAANSPAANEAPNAPDLPIASPGSNPGATPASGGNSSTPPATNGMMAGNGQPPAGTGAQNPTTTPPAAPPPAPPAPPPREPLNCAAPRPTLTGGTQSCTRNASGNEDGQSWFMWFAGNSGCITTFEDTAAFRANWNNSGDYLARMGLQWNETQTFDQIGNIGADLAFTKTGSGGSYSFIGIYGWSNDPLVEYYIVENSFGNGPAVPYATTQRGTFTMDGASYRIYTGTKTNQPSIHGTATFLQVFSVRQTPRECGHVSISEHFEQWRSMGINLGKMYEAKVLVEAGGGTGSATFTTAYVTVD